ncbi:signal peptidase II [Cumulibacter manganitolerans]|uniref:signal peptidase II n=1 Tax=Cumulibacter manganitolerans TaxID=1884992 RepID=UPI001E29D5E6|nr:signal peptidase II [Cumulibacter manganitolerans]
MTDTPQPASDDRQERRPEPAAVPGRPARQRRTVLLFTIAAVALLIDVTTKIWAVHALSGREPLKLAGGAVYLTLARNSGAAFSMGTGITIVISCVVIVVAVGIAVVARKVRWAPWAWALGLILGGALGNLADRIFRHPAPLRGAVIDYLSLFDPYGQVWPIFNVADMCVVCGGILAGLLAIIGRELDGQRTSDDKAETVSS